MPNNKKNGKKKIRKAETVMVNGQLTLDVPKIRTSEFPHVTIITLTTPGRRKLLAITKYNFENIIYPRDKLNWLIIDDPCDVPYEIDDNRVVYVQTEKVCTIGEKRNWGAKKCSTEYIVHMDDDDYYFPEHVMAKIQVMIKYNKKCVLSHSIGAWDFKNNTSRIVSGTGGYEHSPEASLAYTKDFWAKQKFGNKTAEGYAFLKRRHKQMIDLPFWFNIISITHSKNQTRGLRSFVKTGEKNPNFWDIVFPDKFKHVVNNNMI